MQAIVYKYAEERPLRCPFISNYVPAGFPSPAEDAPEEHLDLSAHLVKHPESTFFLRVSGDSMTGAGIFDGDLLIVDRSITPSSGDIVIAAVNGEFTVKRLIIDGKNVKLRPENPKFKTLQMTEYNEIDVWGVVTNSIKSFR